MSKPLSPLATSPAPYLVKRREWCDSLDRTDQWYRDNVNNPKCDPPLPPTIKQGRGNFVRYEDGEQYKRALLRKTGIIRAPGRPRKTDSEQSKI